MTASTDGILTARSGDPEPAARHERHIIDRWTFEAFERLALTEDTAPCCEWT